MSQLPFSNYGFVPGLFIDRLLYLKVRLDSALDAAYLRSPGHSSLDEQGAKRLLCFYEQRSDPEVEPFPYPTKYDFCDAILRDVLCLLMSHLDDSITKFTKVYNNVVAARGGAVFKTHLLEHTIHEVNLSFQGSQRQRNWTNADLFMEGWQLFDQDYENLLERIHGIEFTACGEDFKALSSLKQQEAACCL